MKLDLKNRIIGLSFVTGLYGKTSQTFCGVLLININCVVKYVQWSMVGNYRNLTKDHRNGQGLIER